MMEQKEINQLILLMLSSIMKRLEIDDSVNPDLVTVAVITGNMWGLAWEYASLIGVPEVPNSVAREVADHLDMWLCLERGYANLSNGDRITVSDAASFGVVRFRGYDGNNEGEHMSAAGFMIEDLGQFSHFAKRDLNSHSPSVEAYRRMFRAFEPMRKTLATGDLSAEEMVTILSAG
jgi:uncharacterized protein YfbU (UPF0304 family)